ncbi:hypothetical protein GGR56DRAFT_643476 [Xylariaceae sp. FL0804]|nr:hypothetical protein GGR56DRAFT_643476 [Xylariaceae sp. FL0804]
MSKLVDDVKTGLKGVKGTGDAVRGGLMEATDQAFDSQPNHPQTQASQSKNASITEKGKQHIADADEMLARREREKESGVKTHPGHRVQPGSRQL